MWISSKRYDSLWDRTYQLQKEKDELIRILSGIVVGKGGKIIIPIPSTDSRTLRWKGLKDGTLVVESEVYGLKEREMST